MKILRFDCTPENDDREDERQVFTGLRHAWFYMTTDGRTGERVPLIPLGVDSARLDNALKITDMINEFSKDPDGGTSDPVDAKFEMALRDSEITMLTQYWHAYQGQRGHPAHAAFFKRVNAKLQGAESIEDKKWKEMQAEKMKRAIDDLAGPETAGDDV